MKLLKIKGRFLLWTIILFILLLSTPYLFAPVYDFPKTKKFQGEKLYNPYQNLDAKNWKKGNFQVQSRVWGGLTDGRKNSNELIDSTFRFLDYDIIGTSDYMQINQFGANKPNFISVYEHGWSIFKTHQIVLGAERVNWLDYFFFQSTSMKQNVINKLKAESDVLILAHPCLRNGYTTSDLVKLSGYDAMEILNFYCESVYHWDTALSNGHYVAAIGNDDVHDISNPDEVGQYCTFINTASLHGDSVVDAIKKNRTFAVNVFRYLGDSWEVRKQKHDALQSLRSVQLHGDTLVVYADTTAKTIKFFGQDGELKHTVNNSPGASYIIQNEDTYIRAEIQFYNRNVFYLNPVVRFEGNWPPETPKPEINLWKTWVYRFFAISIYVFIIYLLFLWIRKSRKKA